MFVANQASETGARAEGGASVPAKRAAVVCRRIAEGDLDGVVEILERGFPERPQAYWELGLRRMRDRPAPKAYPRYGYVMTAAERIVGAIILIFSETADGAIRGNVSSWIVDPEYRSFSHMLLAIPLRLKGVTFINISPTPSTIGTITAQGFQRYVDGTFHAFPALAGPFRHVEVREISAEAKASPLLARHAGYGCLSFEVHCSNEVFPFIFQKSRLLRDKLPCAQLVYCRKDEDFVRFAGPLGRCLLRRGFASVILDATGPIAGLPGRYVAGRRLKYYRGTPPPRLNHLSDTELVLFGI